MKYKDEHLCPICHKELTISDVWCTQCYVEFAKEHNTTGAEALVLKKKMDKERNIPEPKIWNT